jgi:c-di-GMP phosphodiesterase
MLLEKLRKSTVICGFMLFLASLISCVYYTYSVIQRDTIAAIDNRLINAAISAKHILGDDYHAQVNQTQSINFANYERKTKQLSELAQALDIAYVYSMVLINDKVYLSASSYTQEDQNNGLVTQFLDLYPEATATNIAAFLSTEPVFEIATNQWGNFKAVYVPHIDKNGISYLSGAAIRQQSVKQMLAQSALVPALLAGFFLLISILVVVMYKYLAKRAAMRDSGTGFENHIALEKHFANSSVHHMQMAIIWVHEIENINRFYGTKVGDKVMKKLLTYFQQHSAKNYRVYRIATNKLVLLTAKDTPYDELTNLILSYNFNTPFLVEPFIYISLRAGIARGNKSLLLKNAHIAALQAKQGNHHIVNYSEAVNDSKALYLYNLEIAHEVREAFDNKRVVPYFQAVIDNHTQQTLHYECTPRIVTAHGEILTPDAFTHTVQRLRMDGLLTHRLFTQCINRFRKTQVSWSLTVSIQDILDPNINEYIANELQRYPHPANITLVLLEPHVIANYLSVRAFITMIKSKGIKVMIHSFGNDFANTLNILKLEIDGIKLDGMLVKQIVHDKNTALFVTHTAATAKQHGIQLIATMVENKAIADALHKANVTLMQGNYIAQTTSHVNPLSTHSGH